MVKTDEEIDSILSIPENMTIINSSKWSPVQPINIMTKSTLLQQLIYEEVIDKRHCQLNGIKRGLEYFGLVSLCKRYPEKLCAILVYQEKPLEASTFVNLFSIIWSSLEANEEQIIQWFFEYLKERGNVAILMHDFKMIWNRKHISFKFA